MFLERIIEKNAPVGGDLAPFIGLGVGALNTFLPSGWGIRPSKKCPGFFPGGWSGLKLTDT